MSHFLDLHCHVLPALDDGARDAAHTRAMLESLRQLGFDEICATPHQKAAQFLPSADDIQAAYAVASGIATELGGLTLHLGAENYWDDVFFARARDHTIPCYTGGKAFLFEISPHHLPPRLEEQLFAQRAHGLLPVLAHPERYRDLEADPDRARDIARSAALVVDLPALEGAHGPRACKAARALVLGGIAHAVATDAHDTDDLVAAAAGLAWLRRKLGGAVVTALLEHHPRQILRGELPETA